MANPKRKIVKKVASFIKNRANSTDNMTRGPIDKSINKVNMRAGRRKKPTREDMIPDINPNQYGYGTGGMYQSAPKLTVRERTQAKKQYLREIYKGMRSDVDDIPF